MVVVVICVLLHYEALQWLARPLTRLVNWQRRRILLLIFSVLALHIAEIWIFGLGYALLPYWPINGSLVAQQSLGFLDHVYFSAVSFTTLGLGDIVPIGPIRFLTGTESLSGFVLVTWSASFTYLEMQRFWRNVWAVIELNAPQMFAIAYNFAHRWIMATGLALPDGPVARSIGHAPTVPRSASGADMKAAFVTLTVTGQLAAVS